MNKEKIGIPKLRFPGFTGAWEQRKLGEISKKVTKKNKDNTYTETLTNSAEYGIINQRDFFDKDISNQKNLSGYYVVQPDDFVYNPRISNLGVATIHFHPALLQASKQTNPNPFHDENPLLFCCPSSHFRHFH